ncbi:Lrp/AsnC family transcriptional regulator [Streptomyces sp. wa22]|uniref:Lrp/AsnC family transcriptional regulator n=1 Tax=Streptomyces sp. wa22 TaxID=1828244 RepID=UPI0021C8D800|nr:Lrp/AsnC ligand binding domain-containing protein [Streptomyces sp. wa22]
MFDKPFFLILNLAVGGYWPGDPDGSTVLPQQLVVDYVRVITGTGPALSPAALGHPVLAFVHLEVTQGHLDEVGDALAAVPEIIEAFSTTGGGDLLTRVVARDNGHLEDVIQQLIQLPGVVRTRTEVALRERVAYRVLPLVEAVGRAAGTP